VKLAAALGSLISGVHHFYDFATFHLLASPACSYLLAAVADARAAHLDPGVLHPDLALLPITPVHHQMIMVGSASHDAVMLRVVTLTHLQCARTQSVVMTVPSL
jgi:hypothetical protein